MSDAFSGTADAVHAPATRAFAVSPHDTDPLTDIPKALYIGTGGTIVLSGVAGGGDTIWKNVAAGTILPVRAGFVRATGTTAADIVALV